MQVTVVSINMHLGVRYLPQPGTEHRLKTFGILVHRLIRDQDLAAGQDFWLQSVSLRRGLGSKRKKPANHLAGFLISVLNALKLF
jgi:hypothetical protein